MFFGKKPDPKAALTTNGTNGANATNGQAAPSLTPPADFASIFKTTKPEFNNIAVSLASQRGLPPSTRSGRPRTPLFLLQKRGGFGRVSLPNGVWGDSPVAKRMLRKLWPG